MHWRDLKVNSNPTKKCMPQLRAMRYDIKAGDQEMAAMVANGKILLTTI